LERFAEQDATDHFYSLHSKAAIAKLKNMRPLDAKEDVPSVDPIDKGKGATRGQKDEEKKFRDTHVLNVA
jgi:hypothetical protein